MDTPNHFDSAKTQYLIDEDLKAAVEVAIELGMPLLLTGEPGTGKTRLAYYVAENMLSGAELVRFNTKTSSVAKDLLYRYNALKHFRDSSQSGNGPMNPLDYVTFEALGKAIKNSARKRHVVLVDEIDKAPRDFPNDVLFEFDEMGFNIEEAGIKEMEEWMEKTGEQLPLDKQGFLRFQGNREMRPVLILTSNSEKNLPDAFLRRCAYYHIPFPEKEQLMKIVHANVPLKEEFGKQMQEDAIDHFLEIRDLGLRKAPATAELLAWMHLLQKFGLDVKKGLEGNNREIRSKIKRSYTVLSKNKEDRDKILEEFLNDA